MEGDEEGQSNGEERTGRCSSIPISIRIGNPSPGNSHHGPFVVRAETSVINGLTLNTEPITLPSILEFDACGAPSRINTDLLPAPSLPKNVIEGETVEATDHDGSKYVLIGKVKFKYYANYRHRLASFVKIYKSVKTREELASAGFIFYEPPDSVICFSCGVGFKDWQPEDDPWRDHAAKSRLCSYVQVMSSQIVMRTNASATALRTNSSTTTFWQEERQLINVERNIYQVLNETGYSFEKIRLAIRYLQLKGVEINPEVVANRILDMDQKKKEMVASLCYLCKRDFRNGYTLCPCGHLAICLKCNVHTVALCPVCGDKVERYVRTYPE
ncbi:hypothetical protein CHS0354_006284 [Potamilus streckersoni]|uniref:RING-type domain-containing protein n=1 Tax=Potamilus streckersoni TaxID=2493646 RepID=A0AAE0VNY9_9BIVA|nr:hypothetical protein CHS0354_006284 [Potamilus streckersoni]